MSGFGRRLADLLLPDLTGQRALEETVADWRDERGRASSAIGRLRADVTSGLALFRVVAAMSGRQLVSRDAWLPFGLTVLATALAVTSYVSLAYWLHWELARFGGWPTALGIPAGVALLFAPIAAIGLGLKRDGPRPLAGLLTLSFVFLVLVCGWATPVANQAYRQAVWTTLQSRWELPPPSLGVAELPLQDLVRAARTAPTVTKMQAQRRLNQLGMIALLGPTLLLLGEAVRQRISRRRSWRLAQAVSACAALVSLVVATAAWPLIRQLALSPQGVPREAPVSDYWVPLFGLWIIIALALPAPGHVSRPEPPRPGGLPVRKPF